MTEKDKAFTTFVTHKGHLEGAFVLSERFFDSCEECAVDFLYGLLSVPFDLSVCRMFDIVWEVSLCRPNQTDMANKILRVPKPAAKEQLRSFLGLIGYYRK